MQVHEFGRLNGDGSSSALDTFDGEGASPFTEGREVMVVISPDDAFAVSQVSGSVAIQTESTATGTAFEGDELTSQEEADVVAGMTIMKTITLPARIRFTIDHRTGGSVRAYLVAAGS